MEVKNINGYDLIDEKARQSINELQKEVLTTHKKFIFIGDSYGEQSVNWVDLTAERLGLTNEQVIKKCLGGSRFYKVEGSTSFEELLTQIPDDNEVTDIIVCGGYNDQGVPGDMILSAVASFKAYANTHFPNAKIYIGHIGLTTNHENFYKINLSIEGYKNACSELNLTYLSGVEYSLREYSKSIKEDQIHPTEAGSKKIAQMVSEAYLRGYSDFYAGYRGLAIEGLNGFTINGTSYYSIHNGNLYIGTQNAINLYHEGYNLGATSNTIEIGNIGSVADIIGNSFNMTSIPVNLFIQSEGKYYTCGGTILIKNKKVELSIHLVNDAHSNFEILAAIKWMQIQRFNASFDSLLT